MIPLSNINSYNRRNVEEYVSIFVNTTVPAKKYQIYVLEHLQEQR